MKTTREIIGKLESLIQNERYTDALSVLRKFDSPRHRKTPSSPDYKKILLLMGKTYLFNHQCERVKECLSQLECGYKDIASDLEYVDLKRQVLIVEGKTKEASSLLEDATRNNLPKCQRHLITYYKGDIHFLNGEYSKANICFQECQRHCRLTGDTYMQGKTLYMLGYIAFQRCFFDVAVSYFEQSLALFSELKNNYSMGASYKMMGIIAYRTGKYSGAQEFLSMAYQCFRRCSNSFGIINTIIAQSRVSSFQGDHANAEQLLLKSYRLSARIGYTRGSALSAEFLGEVHYHRENYKESLAYLDEARQLADEIAPRGDITVEVYRRLGDLYIVTGELDKAERQFRAPDMDRRI